MKPKIASIGTGSTDGFASQLLCKINAIIFAWRHGFEYIDIPFDDSYIKGNSGHRFGSFSTALQNIAFNFSGFDKVNPINLTYEDIFTINYSEIPNEFRKHEIIHEYLLNLISSNKNKYNIFILNGFSNIYYHHSHYYYKIFQGNQPLINLEYLNKDSCIKDKFQIAIHIRRGDLLLNEINFNRIIPVSYFNNIVSNVVELLDKKNIAYEISIYSEEEINELNFAHTYVGQKNPLNSFINLTRSDLIVASKSAHSTVAAMVSGKQCIYPADSWLTHLPFWIAGREDGSIDKEKFSSWLNLFY